jgi:hypothetical protein
MEPSNHLSVGGPCLALLGDTYAFYVKGTQLVANLSQLENPSTATGEWINTWTGDRVAAQLSGAQATKLRKPEAFGEAPALLLVKRGL